MSEVGVDATLSYCGPEGSAEKIADRVGGRQRREETLERMWAPTYPQRTAPSDPRGIRPARRRFLSAYYRGSVQTVPIEDIVYLRAEHKYVIVRHVHGELLVDESLKSLEDELPDRFLRIHRNALVARNRVAGLEKMADGEIGVRLSDCSEQLLVSRRHRAYIRGLLLNGYDGLLAGPDFPSGHSTLAHVTFALPVEIRDRLERASERTGETVAGFVERALRTELERLQGQGSEAPGSHS